MPWTEAKQAIDAIHQSVAEEYGNCAHVPSEGLSAKSDRVHFNAQSLREFGHRYFKAFQQLE